MECYIPSTHSTQIINTVEFLLTVIPIPKTSSEYYLHQLIGDIIDPLADPKPSVTSLSFGDDTQNAVKKIATLLYRAIPAPKYVDTPLTPPSPQPTFPS